MTYDYRTATEKLAYARMPQEEMVKVFDTLKTGDKVKVALTSVMGHGSSETGTPTVYTLGRKGKGRMGETFALLREGQKSVKSMMKITLYKHKQYHGEGMAVDVALGDMGATLLSLEKA